MTKKFYITTAIAYTNGKPHMGHALEIVIADALARMWRMMGKDVEFQTGTDEHGIKNRRTAKEANKEIKEFIQMNVDAFQELYTKLDISYDTFLRTSTDDNHHMGAQKLWNELFQQGDIYKKSYSGVYCAGCEAFKTEKDLVDGKCPDHPNGEIEKIEEENYFFKLRKYKDQVIKLIKNDAYKITPESRKNEILAFLEKAEDISFSRPKTSLPRGVEVPNDPEHVMYVRCDALSNYITGQGYGSDQERFEKTRPCDIHIIGKDILRFHAAFWPAMLLSANIPLPKELLAHGFLTLNGQKMGKSTGNTVDPIEVLETYPRDAFVFNLLYDVPTDSDGDFSLDRLKNSYNAMLIGARGNLVNRVTKLSQKYKIEEGKNHPERLKEIFPIHKRTTENEYREYGGILADMIIMTSDNKNGSEDIIKGSLEYYLKNHNIQGYIHDRYKLVQKANEYITTQEPRIKYKDEATRDEAIADLQFLLYIVKNLAILSAPILVDGFEAIKRIFGNEELNTIQTTQNIDFKLIKKAFDMTEFEVKLNPEIIYQRVEE